jgi:hypothetical protein
VKWLESRVLWGTLLLLGGVLFLLQNLGILAVGNLFWGILLGLAGVFFFSIFFQNRENWWALIPAFTILSISLVVILDWLAPAFSDRWSSTLVLGGIALSFLVIYALERDLWWTLIPGGVMLTLALVTSLDEFAPDIETGGVFFLGLGATFGALAMTNSPLGQLRWAWIPAVVLVIVGVFMLATTVNLIAYIAPAALVLVGVYLIWRTVAARKN